MIVPEIISELHEGQGFGNQMWLIASGQGIAQKLGFEHTIKNMSLFKGFDTIQIKAPETKVTNPSILRERMFLDEDLNYLACDFDERVACLDTSALLRGLFQSEKYFFNNFDLVRTAILPRPSVIKLSQEYKNFIALNIRGGEYKRHKHLILPEQYWHDAISYYRKTESEADFLIVTDDAGYAKAILPGYPIVSSSIHDCYAALYGAKAIALSNSSFGYFPVKTRSDNPKVLAPHCWSRYGNKFQRWASPANFYKNWIWLDQDGKIWGENAAEAIAIETSRYYQREHNVLIRQNTHDRSDTYIKFAKVVKRCLAIIFPKHLG